MRRLHQHFHALFEDQTHTLCGAQPRLITGLPVSGLRWSMTLVRRRVFAGVVELPGSLTEELEYWARKQTLPYCRRCHWMLEQGLTGEVGA